MGFVLGSTILGLFAVLVIFYGLGAVGVTASIALGVALGIVVLIIFLNKLIVKP